MFGGPSQSVNVGTDVWLSRDLWPWGTDRENDWDMLGCMDSRDTLDWHSPCEMRCKSEETCETVFLCQEQEHGREIWRNSSESHYSHGKEGTDTYRR